MTVSLAARPAATKITEEMIEAAAMAIRDQVGGRSGFVGVRRPRAWNALPPTLRDAYRAEAFAALSAALAVANST
jgi:hypothetical protein